MQARVYLKGEPVEIINADEITDALLIKTLKDTARKHNADIADVIIAIETEDN